MPENFPIKIKENVSEFHVTLHAKMTVPFLQRNPDLSNEMEDIVVF